MENAHETLERFNEVTRLRGYEVTTNRFKQCLVLK